MNINNKLIANLREDYRAKTLEIEEVARNPIQQFDLWFKEALNSTIREPNAMTLATIGLDAKPSARIVLLKGFNEDGFLFYTNYESQKGKDLAHNPNVAVVFLWKELERQVRIEGIANKISASRSYDYFKSRPKGSQVGAWASPQSQTIVDRKWLENKYAQLAKEYANQAILPKPPNWGGYQIVPSRMEFWQGRSSRLHDRINYTLQEEEWLLERLAP